MEENKVDTTEDSSAIQEPPKYTARMQRRYICEFIKRYGYHGVMYESSVGDGINIALFDPGSVVAGTVQRFRVSRVSVEVEN